MITVDRGFDRRWVVMQSTSGTGVSLLLADTASLEAAIAAARLMCEDGEEPVMSPWLDEAKFEAERARQLAGCFDANDPIVQRAIMQWAHMCPEDVCRIAERIRKCTAARELE